jgi:hypothetical protein
MPLTSEDRAKLDECDPGTVRMRLIESGATKGGAVRLGDGSTLPARDIEAWLADKSTENAKLQRDTLWWAKVAGGAAIVGIIVGAASIVVTIWLAP